MTDLLLLRPVATTVTLTPGQLAQVDVHDSELVDDTLERVHVTLGDHELVLEAPDMTAAVDGLRRVLDAIEEGALDARQAAADAARHICWCGTRLDPDEDDCGSAPCARLTALDLQGRIR